MFEGDKLLIQASVDMTVHEQGTRRGYFNPLGPAVLAVCVF